MRKDKDVKKDAKEYQRLLDKKSELRNKYYDIVEESECESCDYYNHGNVKELSDRFAKCNKCENLNKILKICFEIENINGDIEDVIKKQ